MPDLLHLFLRITGKLSNIFYKKLQEHDGFTSNEYKEAYETFLKTICKIKDPIIDDENTKKKKLKDLRGDEYKRIAKNIQELGNIFKNLNKINEIMTVWKTFFGIYNKIKMNSVNTDELQKDTLTWFGTFLSVYSHEDVTPYIHVFVYHLFEFQKINETISTKINKFNLEGLEKKNDIVTCQYYRSTNRKNHDFLKQLLLKNNRLDILSCNNNF